MRAAAVALLIAWGTAGAAEPAEWLKRASDAVKTTDYRGVLVYSRGGDMDTLEIVHRHRDGQEWQRVISLSGEPREVIRKNGTVTCMLPGNHVVSVGQRSVQRFWNNVSDVAEAQSHYRLRDLGQSRLAGRSCRVVGIEPRDEYRYGYRVWLDEESGLPLKLEVRHGNRRLEQMMFTEIEFPESIPDDAFEPSFDPDAYQWIKHGPAEASGRGTSGPDWDVSRLPPGFRLAEEGVRKLGVEKRAMQLLFTDGIATVSAFVALNASRRPLEGGSEMGAISAYGRRLEGHHVTVVGEVPQATVRFIAEHLRPKP